MNAGSAHQENPLAAPVRVTFPASARTIGAALDHLLADSAEPAIKDRLQQALPQRQRSLGPARLIDAVQALCGEPFSIVVDPVNRLISCELREPGTNHESE